MKQQTFSDFEYSNRKRKTKREEFLEIMDEIIPWDEWVGIIMPFYPSGKRGRPPKGIEVMLRMYLVQVWFNLSDEGTEDAINDTVTLRAIPDAGKQLKDLTVTQKGVGAVQLANQGNGVYTFAMPGGNVDFAAVFTAARQTPVPKQVVLSPQKITVNGAHVTVEAYNIDGTNYFKLRDLAASHMQLSCPRRFGANSSGSPLENPFSGVWRQRSDQRQATVRCPSARAFIPCAPGSIAMMCGKVQDNSRTQPLVLL